VHDLRTKSLKHIPEPAIGFSEFQSHWDKLVPSMRILCMSELADSAPMWAHYADQHRGVVLEFQSLDAVDSPLLIARPVMYQDEPPRLPSMESWVRHLTGQIPIDLKQFFKEYELIKATQWSYEREWRVLSYAGADESGPYADYSFFGTELHRVIIGANCPMEHELEITRLLKHGYAHALQTRARWDHDGRRILV
jgi:Protein of unknown function (DUF2971)